VAVELKLTRGTLGRWRSGDVAAGGIGDCLLSALVRP
jgi:hypothetical protein